MIFPVRFKLIYTEHMKRLLALLLALSMLLSAYASATDFSACCPSDECPIVECADMGCVPALAAIMPNPLLALPFLANVSVPAIALEFYLPKYFEDIWTPPD